ncbi:hypothetical protein ACQPYA_25145 [Micromonospora sp. CA-263727]|uniref:hypothetical protein n=1 Tax=Micromonospora sp. CA-263727 TaxID=3239967 RepID=UPI003D92E9D0
MTGAGDGGDEDRSGKLYWSVDIPGLTQEQAEALASRFPGLPGTAVDPRQWFTVHIDRETVEVLKRALESVEVDSVGTGLREIAEDWLDSTRGYMNEDCKD